MKFKRGISSLIVFLLLVSLISPSLVYTGGAFAAQSFNEEPAIDRILEEKILWEIEVSEDGLEEGEVDFLLIASPGQEIDSVFISEFDNDDLEVIYEANQASFKLDITELNKLKLEVTTSVNDLDYEEFTLEVQTQAGDTFYETMEWKENTFTKVESQETDQDEEGLEEAEEDLDLDEDEEEAPSIIRSLSSFVPFSGQISNFKSLIIAPGAISNLQVTTNGYGNVSQSGVIYDRFEGNTSTKIRYPDRTVFTPGTYLTNNNNVRAEIYANYNNVGYIDVGSDSGPELLQVGARVTIKNIKLGLGPRWIDNDGRVSPYIELSDNFYSGVFYEYIEEMELEVEFYLSDNPTQVLSFNGENGYMTFLSLNGYNYLPDDDWGLSALVDTAIPGRPVHMERTFEYAASADGSASGTVSKPAEYTYVDGNGVVQVGTTQGSRIFHNPNGTQLNYNHRVAAKGAYYMNMSPYIGPGADGGINEQYRFEDDLGGTDFQDSGVTFSLNGTVNSFKIGSTYGHTWNSFMGVSVDWVPHDPPVKTIQPVADNGDAPGYEMRYHNDLDRFHTHSNGVNHDTNKGNFDEINSFWELEKYFWVDGHNPDDLSEDEILGRYVKTNEEFYYFINQRAISIQTDSLILPTLITFIDALPEGTTLANNSLSDLTLYNVDGSELTLTEDEWSYDESTRELEVKLSIETTHKINQLVRERKDGDVTLRVKSKVTDLAIGDIDEDSFTNKAKTEFYYKGETISKESNRVQTAIRRIDVEKIWEDRENIHELRPDEIEVGLREGSHGDCSGDNFLATITLNDENNWKGSFTSEVVGSGDYCVVEFDPDENYLVSIEKVIEEFDEEVGSCYAHYNYKFEVTNTLIMYNLDLVKEDDEGNKLEGAEFTLFDDKGEKLQAVESDEEGKVSFINLRVGNYRVKETEGVPGYDLSDIEIKFTIDEEGKVQITSPDDLEFDLTLVEGDENGKIVITSPIVNEKINYQLKVLKVDEDNPEVTLEGAVFELYDEEGELVDTLTTDEVGLLIFENLSIGEYVLKEIKAPEGFKLPTKTIEVEITGEDVLVELVVKNKSYARDLPMTGGIGMLAFALVGVGLTITASSIYPKVKKD